MSSIITYSPIKLRLFFHQGSAVAGS